jgi:hypothetical protein
MTIEDGEQIVKALLEAGYISPSQLAEARAQQKICPRKQLGEILVELGYLSPSKLEKGQGLLKLEREVRVRHDGGGRDLGTSTKTPWSKGG